MLNGLNFLLALFVLPESHEANRSARFEWRSLNPLGPLRWALSLRSLSPFLGIWFVTNLLFGMVATPLGISDASVAWEAHIGGFLAGLLLFPMVDRAEPVRFRAT